MLDETLLSMTGQPKVAYGNAAWGQSPGFGQLPGMGTQPIAPATGLRPPVPVTGPWALPDGVMASNQQKPRAPVLEDSFLKKNDSGEENSVPQDGTASDKKVDEPEKVILDSKEKIEFYRTKMQDLVLYKSRCDNRLNEITERALADKREAEMLGKKYEEKYKQVAEVASKLTIEEATFRDIQERKLELHQAIVNMEQGGSADGILQVRADRIQSDLDELMKALIERCKKHGLEVKSTAIIELPIGWQPGIQEGAAVWDEEWDKFEDEGFANDLTIDVKNASAMQKEKASQDGSLTPDSLSNGDGSLGTFLVLVNMPLRVNLRTPTVKMNWQEALKDSDSDKHRDFFGAGDFVSRFGNSPRYSEAGDGFDNFSRFDSFSMQEGGFSPRERLTRFDSVSSTKDFGHSRAFSSFDDADPFGSSGPFKVGQRAGLL
ncbi:hypothetical protein GH714_007373 [Hevea brasiliensis]|uniref:Uncharacterized protein n=1 Tax=Hevea brasiliensis TaxID=3981 RepID=A0A6A6M970_HEVBR|nr:hypothetical protein GH714_007373 [Hevea brasiliensis]